MGPLGTQELVFIFLLALLLFGPKELPKLGKTIGKAMTEFKKAQTELKSTFDREMSNLEKETGIKELVATNFKAESYDYDNYDGYYENEYTPTHSPATTDGAFATQSAETTAPLQLEAAPGSIANGHLEAAPAAHSAPVTAPASVEHGHAEPLAVPVEAAPKTA